MDDKTLIAVISIICLTVLEAINMLTAQIDGQIAGLVIGTIATIAGYAFGVRTSTRARRGKQ